jgi:hypothetical protein
LAPTPTKEATKFEKKADLEIGEVERVDEEREERLERLRIRKMEWTAKRVQKMGDKFKEDVITGVEVEMVAEEATKIPEIDVEMVVEMGEATVMEMEDTTLNEMIDQAGRTPCPGSKVSRCEKLNVMMVVLGPASIHTPPGGTTICDNSGAGINTNREGHTKI